MNQPLYWATASGMMRIILGRRIRWIDSRTNMAENGDRIIVVRMITERSSEIALVWIIENSYENRRKLARKELPEHQPQRSVTIGQFCSIVRGFA